MTTIIDLFEKYNVAGPRYTSYPTVPVWQNLDNLKWDNILSNLKIESLKGNAISLYIHLPYCESLCTFCACHKRITKNHEVEESYVEALLAEWHLYLSKLNFEPEIIELHLGGGTPSFFSSKNLTILLNGIINTAKISNNKCFSFEGHPNNTTVEHLKTLFEFGFTRVSFGVQDYDPKVQMAIHRIQDFKQVKYITQQARKIGYTSISHDLVFGLPFQKLSSIKNTIEKTLELKPDRIAFYSYAHVPWVKGTGQRGFDEGDLPSAKEKRSLYELGLTMFEKAGYSEIGMDHFALPNDEMFEAMKNGTLHRNFMGYTVSQSTILIGLGVSAISDVGIAYNQNIKDIEAYKAGVFDGVLPSTKGIELSAIDLLIKEQILNIMCRFETTWSENTPIDFELIKQKLVGMAEDGLIEIFDNKIQVLEAGKPYLRNVAMAFDQYLENETNNMFSKTI